MKPPFNLLRVFSIASLITTIILTFSLSWLLSNNLETQLLERDKQLTVSIFTLEIDDELDEFNLTFDEAHLNDEFREELVEIAEEIYGGKGLDMIQMTGEVIWSTHPEKIGTYRNTQRFIQAREGETLIKIKEEPINSDLGNLSLYIPIIRNEKIVGVFEFHRQDSNLLKQIENVKEVVYLFCSLFGLSLYLVMMLIIIPASKTLNHQHRQLLENKEKLIQTERLSAVGEVCGAVAHGLKNPIASVRAAVQLLSMRSVTEEKKNHIITDILHEVDRLAKRLHDLLDFIRPFNPELQHVKLQDVLLNAIRSLSWKAEKENLHLHLDHTKEVNSAYIDAALIEEAILIILSNAMEASKEGDTIQCSIEKQENQNIIVIKDEGQGIPSEVLPKIFEQFFTTRSKGVGLGLSLCKKIMELHQGDIIIESNTNQGTAVKLVFP